MIENFRLIKKMQNSRRNRFHKIDSLPLLK